MAKRSKIRWKNNELDELRKITRNYNAKLRREREKLLDNDRRYEAAHLPGKGSLRDIKKMTRKEMEKERKRMEEYISTGRKYVIDKKVEQSLHSTVRDFNWKIDKLKKNIEKETKKAIEDRQALKREMKGLQKSSDEYHKIAAKIEALSEVVNGKKGRLAALPEKLSRNKLIREASNVEELQEDLKVYKGFLKTGAETLVEVPGNNNNIKETKWQRDVFAKFKPGIDARRAQELKEWEETEAKYGGESAGYTHGEAGQKNEDYRLQPLNIYPPSATQADLKKKLKMMMRERREDYWNARTELARINYIETMEGLIGGSDEGKALMRSIRNMDLKDFKRVLTEEDDLWGLLYDLKHADNGQRDIIMSRIWGEWRKDDYFEWKEARLNKLVDSIE